MKNETKKLIIGTAMAGIFAVGVSAARMSPAFAQDGGDTAQPTAKKNSCKGSCKGKNGCKGKHHKHKKKDAAAPAASAPAADAPKTE